MERYTKYPFFAIGKNQKQSNCQILVPDHSLLEIRVSTIHDIVWLIFGIYIVRHHQVIMIQENNICLYEENDTLLTMKELLDSAE